MTSYLVQKCAESTEKFIQQCVNREIAYAEVLHAFNRQDPSHNDVLMKLLKGYGRDGVPYILELLSETIQRKNHFGYMVVFLKHLEKNEATEYFSQIWPEWRNRLWDNLDKSCERRLYDVHGKIHILLDNLMYTFSGYDELLEDYLLSRMVQQGAFEVMDDELKKMLYKNSIFQRLRWVLSMDIPTEEEDIRWLERFNIAGLDFANGGRIVGADELPVYMV